MLVDHSYPPKRMLIPQRRVGFQESISAETCLSTRFLAMVHMSQYSCCIYKSAGYCFPPIISEYLNFTLQIITSYVTVTQNLNETHISNINWYEVTK
jgi:hypothetical protein